jgi:hypothetical protein
MKYLVLTIVGVWSAFLTVAQSFHAFDRLLVNNNFSPASLFIVTALTILIGFGYTMLFIVMMDAPIPRMRTLTYCLACGLIVFLIALVRPFDFLALYMRADTYLRNQYDTTIAWLDYGNSVLLVATTLWWSLVGVMLAVVPYSKRGLQ